MANTLILASQSPRRKELLMQLGYQFNVLSPNVDESVLPHESPQTYVERVARDKAKAIVVTQPENACVLAADTCVVVDNNILGKPQDFSDCQAQLKQLSDTTHWVYTAIAVAQGTRVVSEVIATRVMFKMLSEQEIVNYWQTGEPCDKAGSYGIQGIGGQFVKSLEGSYSAVVGLPLYETVQILAEFNLPSALRAL